MDTKLIAFAIDYCVEGNRCEVIDHTNIDDSWNADDVMELIDQMQPGDTVVCQSGEDWDMVVALKSATDQEIMAAYETHMADYDEEYAAQGVALLYQGLSRRNHQEK